MNATRWEVVGGQKGGILVRVGRELDSAEAPSRLGTGALIEEVELKGERLSYRLLEGEGPSEGWVSLKLKAKDLVVKTEKEPRRDVAPAWLAPRGGKKILFLTIPWKGHIVHLKRIATWFEAKGGYDLVAAIFPESEGTMPKSCRCSLVAEDERPAGDFLADTEDGLRRIAMNKGSYNDGIGALNKIVMGVVADNMAKGNDPFALLLKFFFRVLVEEKPDIVVADQFAGMHGLIPAYCIDEKITFAVMNSPGILESWMMEEGGVKPASMDTSEMDEEELALSAKASGIPLEIMKATSGKTMTPEEVNKVVEEHKDKIPTPDKMSLLALIQSLDTNPAAAPFMPLHMARKMGLKPKIMGQMCRTRRAEGEKHTLIPVTFSPSSPALLNHTVMEYPDLFVGPFLPMPEPAADGQMQRDRATFEATLQPMEPELLDWLYEGEASRPIVYMAFGSIVRPNEEMLKRIVDALDGGPWRVLWALPKEMHKLLPAGQGEKEQWRIMSFVPQADVLKCNRVKCFISHNGYNSTVESLCCGVPMVCMPFYMDQYDWAKVVCVKRKAGVQVDKYGSVDELRDAVKEVLSNGSFREGALEASRVMRLQEEAVLKRLSGAMAPPSKTVGYGVSVAAALLLAKAERADSTFAWELMRTSTAEALAGAAA
mmetsp:Transcript_132650/g.412469  ORF Transcript_132650/g.412469 Transcript_132650/m.412469 type:complete len:656 (-) Transcript_132650:34-2001(-)